MRDGDTIEAQDRYFAVKHLASSSLAEGTAIPR
jgi:hypothetical protein